MEPCSFPLAPLLWTTTLSTEQVQILHLGQQHHTMKLLYPHYKLITSLFLYVVSVFYQTCSLSSVLVFYHSSLPWLFNYIYPLSHCPTPPGDSCAHWMHYSEATKTREGWARNLLDEFRSSVEMLKSAVRDQHGSAPAHGSPQHGKQNTRTYSKHDVVELNLIFCVHFCFTGSNMAPHFVIPVGFLFSSVP